ncbi:MAG: hypothetical protein RLZZ176_2826, partial [Cyanobacteriota bacterium]
PLHAVLNNYQDCLAQYVQIKERIKDLKKSAASREESLASLKAFSESFGKLKPLADELSSIDNEISRLSSVEELRIAVSQAVEVLENDDGPDGTSNSLLFTRVIETGTYIIRIRSFGETGLGKFKLKVTKLQEVKHKNH